MYVLACTQHCSWLLVVTHTPAYAGKHKVTSSSAAKPHKITNFIDQQSLAMAPLSLGVSTPPSSPPRLFQNHNTARRILPQPRCTAPRKHIAKRYTTLATAQPCVATPISPAAAACAAVLWPVTQLLSAIKQAFSNMVKDVDMEVLGCVLALCILHQPDATTGLDPPSQGAAQAVQSLQDGASICSSVQHHQHIHSGQQSHWQLCQGVRLLQDGCQTPLINPNSSTCCCCLCESCSPGFPTFHGKTSPG